MDHSPISVDRTINEEIGRSEPRLRAFVDSLAEVPELGFFEIKTARLLAQQLEVASLRPRMALARTGVIADLAGGKSGPTIAVIGELDAMPVDNGDGSSTASHSCGHHLQLATIAAVASTLSPLASQLSGRVRFVGVPAEEFIDLATRLSLRASGDITFLSGKAELVRLGHFDDVDMALLVHATTRPEEGHFAIGGSTNAMIAKWVHYEGTPAHAGAAPHRGVNALAAAIMGLNAINSIRDTFRDEDHIRVHGIITRGGSAVNVVPADVQLEVYVRGGSRVAVAEAERKVDRALWAGAVAVGARIAIRTVPGYLPLRQDVQLAKVAWAAASRFVPADLLREGVDRAGSTDMGDLSHLMPVLQPWAGGVSGDLHSSTFRVEDFDTAVLAPARILSRMIVDLLGGGAVRASEICRTARPPMTREGYLAYLDSTYRSERLDGASVSARADP